MLELAGYEVSDEEEQEGGIPPHLLGHHLTTMLIHPHLYLLDDFGPWVWLSGLEAHRHEHFFAQHGPL
eukprot:2586514-Karenia_brevis.AAC.1